MKGDLSSLKHITDPDEFYKAFVPFWEDSFKENEDDIGNKYYEHLEVLDSISESSYRIFCLFDVVNFHVVYISPRVWEIMGYTKEEWEDLGPTSFLKLLVVRQLKYFLKLMQWIRSFKQHEEFLSDKNWMAVYKGFKFKKQNKEIVSTIIRQVMPRGHIESKLALLEICYASHLTDDDHLSFRVNIKGEGQAIYFKHSKKTYSKMDDIFTKREFEILALMGRGFSTQEISKELFISDRTVSTHKRNMLDKIGAKDASAMLEICKMMGIEGL